MGGEGKTGDVCAYKHQLKEISSILAQRGVKKIEKKRGKRQEYGQRFFGVKG